MGGVSSNLHAVFFEVNDIITRNGNKINGATADLTVSTEAAAIGLVYTGATYGWKLLEK